MKNLFKILILSLLVFGCESDSGGIIGSWMDPDNNIIIFTKDGKMFLKNEIGVTRQISYDFTDNILTEIWSR